MSLCEERSKMNDAMRKSRRDMVSDVAVLSAVVFVSRLVFLYSGGMGEADSMVMAAGMAKSLEPGAHLTECIFYGRQTGPGIYFIFKLFSPFLRAASPDKIILFLNCIGLISATLLIWPLYLIGRAVLGRAVTICCMMLFISSPLVWELGTYFHPIMPAALLLLAAFMASRAVDRSSRGIASYLLTVLLAAACIIMRNEVLTMIPALYAVAVLSTQRRKNTLLLSSVLALAIVGFLLLTMSIRGSAAANSGTSTRYASDFTQRFFETFSLKIIFHTVPWTVMGIGIGTCLSATAGCFLLIRSWRGFSKTSRASLLRGLVIAIVWIGPTLALWTFQPSPILRHFFLITPAVAWLAGQHALSRLGRQALVVATVVAVLGNLLIPEVLYRTYNVRHTGAPKEPNGAFFYYHSTHERRIDRYCVLQKEVARSANSREEKTAGLIIPANWEIYSYVLYGLMAFHHAERSGTIGAAPGIPEQRYTVGTTNVRILLASGFSAQRIPDELMRILEADSLQAYRFAIPRELVSVVAPCNRRAGACVTY
jgi:hypothetical protein